MTINKQWHDKHEMPQNASLQERLSWHTDHAKECGCRPMPEDIKKLLETQNT